ncbi:uncharacterized protein [Periplaneta americana]|uniref:uncharacterized protein isoform X4 n=1 Tax=Periplaneta americana TaxID=6978 RepID=UPI0037E7638D
MCFRLGQQSILLCDFVIHGSMLKWRVNPGSKAAQKGVREGDVISSINGQSTRNITNSDAHALLRNAGQTLHLGLNEECSGSPKRRLHRNIQQDSKTELVKRTTVTKTTISERTTTASVNGAADPNCNNQISGKANGKDGQNAGVRQSSTGSAPDSKGQRRRRRQQITPQREMPAETKEDSDTIIDNKTSRNNSRSTTPLEGSGSKSRRRRRSRGNNRRKCRAGSALGIDTDVSGSEHKTTQDMSTTEPDTDATMSDAGGVSSHGNEIDSLSEYEKKEVEFESKESVAVRVSSVNIQIRAENNFKGVEPINCSQKDVRRRKQETSLKKNTEKDIPKCDISNRNKLGTRLMEETRALQVRPTNEYIDDMSEIVSNIISKEGKVEQEAGETAQRNETVEVLSQENVEKLSQAKLLSEDESISNGVVMKTKIKYKETAATLSGITASSEIVCKGVNVEIDVPLLANIGETENETNKCVTEIENNDRSEKNSLDSKDNCSEILEDSLELEEMAVYGNDMRKNEHVSEEVMKFSDARIKNGIERTDTDREKLNLRGDETEGNVFCMRDGSLEEQRTDLGQEGKKHEEKSTELDSGTKSEQPGVNTLEQEIASSNTDIVYVNQEVMEMSNEEKSYAIISCLSTTDNTHSFFDNKDYDSHRVEETICPSQSETENVNEMSSSVTTTDNKMISKNENGECVFGISVHSTTKMDNEEKSMNENDEQASDTLSRSATTMDNEEMLVNENNEKMSDNSSHGARTLDNEEKSVNENNDISSHGARTVDNEEKSVKENNERVSDISSDGARTVHNEEKSVNENNERVSDISSDGARTMHNEEKSVNENNERVSDISSDGARTVHNEDGSVNENNELVPDISSHGVRTVHNEEKSVNENNERTSDISSHGATTMDNEEKSMNENSQLVSDISSQGARTVDNEEKSMNENSERVSDISSHSATTMSNERRLKNTNGESDSDILSRMKVKQENEYQPTPNKQESYHSSSVRCNEDSGSTTVNVVIDDHEIVSDENELSCTTTTVVRRQIEASSVEFASENITQNSTVSTATMEKESNIIIEDTDQENTSQNKISMLEAKSSNFVYENEMECAAVGTTTEEKIIIINGSDEVMNFAVNNTCNLQEEYQTSEYTTLNNSEKCVADVGEMVEETITFPRNDEQNNVSENAADKQEIFTPDIASANNEDCIKFVITLSENKKEQNNEIYLKDGSDISILIAGESTTTEHAQSIPDSDVSDDTYVTCPGSNNNASPGDIMLQSSEIDSRTDPEVARGSVASEQCPVECRAVVVEAVEDDIWEEVEDFCSGEIDCCDDLLEREAIAGDGGSGCLLTTNTTALLQDVKLTAEEKELLDPNPVMAVEEEENLRHFLHSLNLADYSKEAVNARTAYLKDASGCTVEELYASRRGKRRASLETYPASYNQQRGLEVIVEENSSDYSDGEKRMDEARAVESKAGVRTKGKSWEEAVYIPETDQIVFLNHDSEDDEVYETPDDRMNEEACEEACVQNRSVYYSETNVYTDGLENAERTHRVYQRVENEAGVIETRVISEECSIDVFSADMENVLENSGDIEECDSEGNREDSGKGVMIELAESSDEEGDLSGTWRKGVARQRQHGVEIVFLDEDSGSTSSGTGKRTAEDEAAEDADGEDDPDVLYEAVEFPVLGRTKTRQTTSENCGELEVKEENSSNVIYENVEFHRNLKPVFPTKDSEGEKAKPDVSTGSSSSIYENVEFVRSKVLSDVSKVTGRQTSSSNSGSSNENSLRHLADTCNINSGSDSRLNDNNDRDACKGNNDPSAVHNDITDGAKQLPISNEHETTHKNSSGRELTITEGTNKEKSDIQVVQSESFTMNRKEKHISERVSVENSQKNSDSKTISFVKRILCLLPQRENVDQAQLESIIMQELASGDASEETLKEGEDEFLNVEAIENDAKGVKEVNEKLPVTESRVDIKICNDGTESKEMKLNFKEVKLDSDSKLSPLLPEPVTNRGWWGQENVSFGPRDDEDGLEDLDSITPTNRSRHESSSSDAGSHGTAVFCPSRFSPLSSDADISSYTEDTSLENKPPRKIYSPFNYRSRLSKSRSHENIYESKKSMSTAGTDINVQKRFAASPKTLRDLSIDRVVSLPHGVHILNILGMQITSMEPEKNQDNKNENEGRNVNVEEAVRCSNQSNATSMSPASKYNGKPPLTGSLPNLSSTNQESLTQQQAPASVVVTPSPQPVTSQSSLVGSHWLGMPTREDPNLFVCLSPSQRQAYREGQSPTPEEAENLLDLHKKFIQRRSYNEATPPPPPSRRVFGIRHFFSHSQCPSQFSNDGCKGEVIKSISADVADQRTSTAVKLVPSPRFRTVLTSLDSKIHSEENTGEVIGGLEDVQEEEQKKRERVSEDTGTPSGGEARRESACARSRSSSRLLAILRAAAASSEPQEFQAKHLSPSSSSSATSSPPPLPPLPHSYQHHLAMLGFMHQQKRPSTICCSGDTFLQSGSPLRSPSCYSQSSDDSRDKLWSGQNSNIQSPRDGKPPAWTNQNESTKKERVTSWYGQDMNGGINKERLRVRSLSDWLQLVRFGGSTKDSEGSRSKDSTPPVSACISTQSSPGPVRRSMKDASSTPEAKGICSPDQSDMKDHLKLKHDILERRFSLPEKQLEEGNVPSREAMKPAFLLTSARDDERHEQQLKLLHQRQQQRLRAQQQALRIEQQTQEKRPPLPQQQIKHKQADENKAETHSPPKEEEREQSRILQESQQFERRFDAENYRISKKGDIAIINSNIVMQRVTKQEHSLSRDINSLEERNAKQIYEQMKASQRPKSMPPPAESQVTGGEIFRQQMYLEYMNKVAERAERRRHKVIRLSSVPRDDAVTSGKQTEAGDSNATAHQLESEFMGKVRERMDKLGLKYDEESDDGMQNKTQTDTNSCYVIGGGGECDGSGGGSGAVGTPVCQLPKHLQEFLVIAGGAGTDSDVNSDVDGSSPVFAPSFKATSPKAGVWSPSQKPSTGLTEDSNSNKNQQENKTKEGEDAPPVVWTPKSAGASPTSERKEFRPVNFESPTLPRKNRSATSTPAPESQSGVASTTTTTTTTQESSAGISTASTTFSSVFPPWQSRDDSVLTSQSPTSEKSGASSTISSTLDRRLVQSQSAPASGLSALAAGGSTNIKLPRAQNPTITLLQKAREGQLPRGALYLDHKMNSKEGDKSYISPNEILYSVKKEYESEIENEQRKRIVELGPRKFEGIGPTTKEGIPIVLRSNGTQIEVKDANQAKWYKRMYDSLHRAGKDDEYITIRYKPRRGHYPYTSPGGYLSEPEPALYDSDIGYSAKYATLDRRRIKNKENDFTTSTLPRSRYVPHPASIKYATEVYKNQPGRIEDYEPGHSSISDKETKQWWDEVLDIFDGWLETHSPHHPNYRSSSFLTADAIYQRQASAEPQTTPSTPSNKPFMTYALKESGYESDSTLVFKRRDENLQSQLSPAEQKLAYKTIQKGGEVPLHGLRKPAPERPKEPVFGPVPPRGHSPRERVPPESPHRYVESEVTIHYRSPVRSEAKEALSEEELARRQAEAMRRIYQEERRRKYLQELQDMHSRRHTDNFTPSQKSPIPLNRYDDFLDDVGNKGKQRDRTPEPKLVARALYNFVGQTSRELSFRRGDIIFVRRQIDKNWYEGEHNAMVGLFPFNYVEIIPYDGIRTIPKRPSEGQARAKFNFIAQTHLELSLVKGELVVLTRRVDDNWFEGRIGNRKGIFPVSYVEVLSEPGEKPVTPVAPSSKPITLPASHTILMNGSGIKQSMGQHSYQPSSYYSQNKMTSSYTSSNPYATLPRQSQTSKQPLAPVNQTLHIDTHSEPVPYRALYNYRPQNEDELELCEGDTVYVMEKCDDGWYVGSSQRTGYFGTFPGNYVERI